MRPVLETASGTVCGETIGAVHVFRGVRYGAPTGGTNRFRPPRPCTPWAGIADAVTAPPSAPQRQPRGYELPFYAWYGATQPQREDCLFLNVFTPALGAGRRPVMVWLHGGGWQSCASTAPGTDGTALAGAQDVVVVTVNHRLGLFGYLPVVDLEDERFGDAGQAGLLDIVAALQWVRTHASAIGGDPGNVTIFGQSGGAAKVAALMAMPSACGLFHKAIAQSTSGGHRLMDVAEASRLAHGLRTALDLPASDPALLQDLPPERLLAAGDAIGAHVRPVAGSRTCPAHPFVTVAPSISADVPLLVGTTETETTWYYPQAPAMFSIDVEDALGCIARFLGLDRQGAMRVMAAYRDAAPDADATDLVTAVTTDHLFKRNTFHIADLAAARQGAPVYAYVFARETNAGNGRLRSPHAAEIPFVFGTTDAAAAHCGTGSDIAPMTQRMMATWAAFARTGRPDNSSLPDWPPYRLTDRRTMILDRECRLSGDPVTLAREALQTITPYDYGTNRQSFLVTR
jgi:para-nitrobenzyl esterase